MQSVTVVTAATLGPEFCSGCTKQVTGPKQLFCCMPDDLAVSTAVSAQNLLMLLGLHAQSFRLVIPTQLLAKLLLLGVW